MGTRGENRRSGKDISSQLRKITIFLIVLLAISTSSLIVRYVYLYFLVPAKATVTVPDNLIEGKVKQAKKVELYEGQLKSEQEIDLSAVASGGTVTEYFCVEVSHDEELLLFLQVEMPKHMSSLRETSNQEDAGKLKDEKTFEDILRVKIMNLERDEVICDSLFSEIKNEQFFERLKKNEAGKTTVYYQVDLSLDKSAVGYAEQLEKTKQDKKIAADFHFFIKDDDKNRLVSMRH